MPASPRCLYLADYSFKELLSRPSPTAQEGPDVPRTLPAGPLVTGLLWPGVQVSSSVSSAKLGTLREAASGPSGSHPGAKLSRPNQGW